MSNLKVKDADALDKYLQGFGSGSNSDPYITGHVDFMTLVSLGLVPGYEAVHKFGNASDIDTLDGTVVIWDGTCDVIANKISDYTFSGTADITDIASTDNGDTVDIQVEGLDTNWSSVTQTVTLTGQTVATLSTPLIRVNRMINIGAIDVVGDIYLTTTGAARVAGLPSVGSTVRAIIKDGDNQTQMAIYSVPADKKLIVTNGWTNLARKGTTAAQVVVRLREFGGVDRVFHTISLNSQGSGNDHRPYEVPLPIPPKSDLFYTANVTDNNSGISSGFHGILAPV